MPYLRRIDSILLLEHGFKVTSADASDKMLKYALKQRWSRRKEKAFDAWGLSLFLFTSSDSPYGIVIYVNGSNHMSAFK